MTKENCTPRPFEVKKVNCPDCKRKLDSIEEGKKQCRKCLQYVVFKQGEAIKAVPKEMI